MMRTQTLRAVGGYTEGVLNEDLDMWLRLAPDHLFQYVNKPVGRYRVVHGSSSRSEARMTLDQAKIFKRLATDPRYSRKGLARLLAMRWVLSFARTYGKPPVSLAELGGESELGKRSLVRQLLPAAVTPVWGSAVAWIRRVIGTNLSVLDRGDNGAPQPSDSDMRKRSD
jgi:GNAT superfamily N-acetyltransferase